MRIFLLALFFMSEIGLGMSAASSKALLGVGKCLPKKDLKCVMDGDCTQPQFCSACTDVKAASMAVCPEKAQTYAAVEGLFGYLEGSCSDVCGVGDPLNAVRAKAEYKSGDTVVIAANSVDGKTGQGIVYSNGLTSLADISYTGLRKVPGTLLTTEASVSAPISSAVVCVKAKKTPLLTSCFQNIGKCSDKGLAGTSRCSVCKATASCSDRADLFSALFGFDCSGCN